MRQDTGQRRKLKRVLLICALGVGVLLLPMVAWRIGRYCYVEMAVRAFQSNSSQARADRLIDLLDDRSPTQGQAARILRLLLEPKVATRSAYAIGRKPTISTLLPFYLHFHTTMSYRVDVLAGDQSRPTYSHSTCFGTIPYVWSSPVAWDEPGKFSMELRYHYLLAPSMEGRSFYFTNLFGRLLYRLLSRIRVEPWLLPPEKEWYQVHFNVPVDIDVVEQANVEQVQLCSNPELDSRIRMAFSFRTLSGRSEEPWALRVSAKRLPWDVAFHCVLELPDGTRMRSSWSEEGHLLGYAGRDLEATLYFAHFHVNQPGKYDAKLIFEPDPNYAFEEPTIKSIWSGKLEFPIRFTGVPEPNTGE
jgi:hypothetical protein